MRQDANIQIAHWSDLQPGDFILQWVPMEFLETGCWILEVQTKDTFEASAHLTVLRSRSYLNRYALDQWTRASERQRRKMSKPHACWHQQIWLHGVPNSHVLYIPAPLFKISRTMMDMAHVTGCSEEHLANIPKEQIDG